MRAPTRGGMRPMGGRRHRRTFRTVAVNESEQPRERVPSAWTATSESESMSRSPSGSKPAPGGMVPSGAAGT